MANSGIASYQPVYRMPSPASGYGSSSPSTMSTSPSSLSSDHISISHEAPSTYGASGASSMLAFAKRAQVNRSKIQKRHNRRANPKDKSGLYGEEIGGGLTLGCLAASGGIGLLVLRENAKARRAQARRAPIRPLTR